MTGEAASRSGRNASSPVGASKRPGITPSDPSAHETGSLATGGILLSMEDITAPMNSLEIFEKDMPLHIEIGSGKGRFLIEAASAEPDIGYIGVEYASKWARYAADRISRTAVRNVRIVAADALEFMETRVSAMSVEAIHVYFPDPWPKRRHEKRRIWGERLVREMIRVLKPGGMIRFATDIRGYFLSIQRLLSSFLSLEQVPMSHEPATGYARKFVAAGRPVFASQFVKRCNASPDDDENSDATEITTLFHMPS